MRKNHKMKPVLTALVVCAMILSMTACGASPDKESSSVPVESSSVPSASTSAPSESSSAPSESSSVPSESSSVPSESSSSAPAESSSASSSEKAASGTPMSEEDYETTIAEKITLLDATVIQMQTEAAALSEGGDAVPEDVQKIFSTINAACQDIIGLQAPEKYAEAQAKFTSACQALADYTDGVMKMMQPDAKEEDLASFVKNGPALLGTYGNDMQEGGLLYAAAAE